MTIVTSSTPTSVFQTLTQQHNYSNNKIMLLLTQLEYTLPFISSCGALDARNGKSSRNFIHPFLILAVAARSAPPYPSRVCHQLQKLFTHPYVAPFTTRFSTISFLDCTVTSLTLETIYYQRQVTTHTTKSTFYILYTRVCPHSFPIDTTGPIYRVYNHLPTIAANHYFKLS